MKISPATKISYKVEDNMVICYLEAPITIDLYDMYRGYSYLLRATDSSEVPFIKSPKEVLNELFVGKAVLKDGDEKNDFVAHKIAMNKAYRKMYAQYSSYLSDLKYSIARLGMSIDNIKYQFKEKEFECDNRIKIEVSA